MREAAISEISDGTLSVTGQLSKEEAQNFDPTESWAKTTASGICLPSCVKCNLEAKGGGVILNIRSVMK